MTKVIKDTQLEQLGTKLVQVIKNRQDCFETIEIVFPNLKLTHWFKAFWLKNNTDILMNVELTMVNKFTLRMLDMKDKQYSLAGSESLRNAVIQVLSKKSIIQGLLDNPVSKSYCEYYYQDNQINGIKIYDLANKLATLFASYDQDAIEINKDHWQRPIYDETMRILDEHGLSLVTYLVNEKHIKTKKENKTVHFFGFMSFDKNHKLVIDEYAKDNNVIIYEPTLEEANTVPYSITSTPSKLREIEWLHSKVCELIKDNNVAYSDFIVFANNLSDYETTIARVFKQDDIEFPNIPYSINDRQSVDSNITLALRKLFEILNKKFFTRLDFAEIINNPVIQQSRDITPDDIEAWTDAILKMNVYRLCPNGQDDWDYARKRVLSYLLVNVSGAETNTLELKDGKYIPYSAIALSNESIVKFVSMIDDLQKWRKDFINIDDDTNKLFANQSTIELVKDSLDKFFSVKDDDGFETNKLYMKVLKVISEWETFINQDSSEDIPLRTLFYALIEASKKTVRKTGETYMNGITFTDFSSETVLPAKYVFLIGANVNNFPSLDERSEIDYRIELLKPGEKLPNKLSESRKKAFFIQYQNVQKHFYISYINSDLKTDEELYLASFVNDLYLRNNYQEKLTDNKQIYNSVSLDETRDWNNLYTRAEFMNKGYFNNLYIPRTVTNETVIGERELPKKVTVRNMVDFLTEPLKYNATKLFGRKDEDEEKLHNEYEPFFTDGLTNSSMVKVFLSSILNNDKNNQNIDDIIEKLKLEHKIPTINKEVEDTAIKNASEVSKEVKEAIINITDNKQIVGKIPDLLLEVDNHQWILTSNTEIISYQNDEECYYFEIKKLENPSKPNDENYPKVFMLYVNALMDVASKKEQNYIVTLVRNNEDLKITFNLLPSEAKDILNNIYKAMNNPKNIRFLPGKYLSNKVNSKDHRPVEEYKDLVKLTDPQYGKIWNYFGDAKMFDLEHQLGYEDRDFNRVYFEARKEQAKLIKFYDEVKE